MVVHNKPGPRRPAALEAPATPAPGAAGSDVEAGADLAAHVAEAARLLGSDGGGRGPAGRTAAARAARAGLDTVAARPRRARPLRKAATVALFALSLLGATRAQAQPTLVQARAPIEMRAPPPIPVKPPIGADARPPPPPERAVDVDTSGAPVVAAVSLPHAGLPDTLLALPDGMTVAHGSDPGDFYCEHAFFTATEAALGAGSSVLTDAEGEPLTSFLHNPGDDFTYDASKVPVQAERHAQRREIVGAAIRGYYEIAKPQIGDAPFRMLVTGYGPFGGVVDNPTGDFVAHVENVDAAVQAAFGSALVDAHGQVLSEKNGVVELRYRIQDPSSGDPRIVRITAALLPVDDSAIDGGPRSLQALIAAQKPQAVLSMGVAGGSPTFLAEFHADDGGLAVTDGKYVHDDGKAPGRNQADNYSLARAFLVARRMMNPHDSGRGGAAPVVAVGPGGG